jgi:hypothetical protein
VWVSPQEVELICLFLKMNFVDFAAKYLRRVGNRFSFQERMVAEAFECIFFDGIEKNALSMRYVPLDVRHIRSGTISKSIPSRSPESVPGSGGEN